MRKTKWYNWVGDPIWDDYYGTFWRVLGIGSVVILLAICIAFWRAS